MTRAVVTGAIGDRWRAIADITWPRIQRYASSIGAMCYGFSESWTSRPPAWEKLIWIAEALAIHDEVLWLDADVLVCDRAMGVSVFGEVSLECEQAMVMHPNPDHYNTGVWALRDGMIPSLVAAAMEDDCVHHRWWEQAALHRVMERRQIATHRLPEEWNCWSGSPPEIEPFFRHACGMPDQLAAVRGWAS
jgi:hypothetical protein